MQNIDAQEHLSDRNTSFAALGIGVSTTLVMASISMKPETSPLSSIFAGAVAGVQTISV